MAEQSGFFDAHLVDGVYDRVYLARSFAKYFASFIGNGVFGGKLNDLLVKERTTPNMGIRVSSGQAWINGYWYENDTDLLLPIDIADGVYDRIDSVVVRFFNSERKISIVVVRGVAKLNPTSPELVRNSDFYDLKIAEILIKAGSTKVLQANITDTRLNSLECGLVAGVIQQVDTTEFGLQINSYISQYQNEYNAFLQTLQYSAERNLESVMNSLNALVSDESAITALALKIDETSSKNMLVNQAVGFTKKNLTIYPYVETSKIENGITWVDNKDGTVTANGKASSQAHFLLHQRFPMKPGKYILTAGLETSTSTYFAYIEKTPKPGSAAVGNIFYSSYQKTPFEITEYDIENYNFYYSLVVSKNVTVTNLTFRPLLRKAEILDETWEPYRLSVDEIIREDEEHKNCFYRINWHTGIKEWFNAPNIPGEEFCLTERWDNKPVYQKIFYAASLPNNSYMSINVPANFTKVISITGFAVDSENNLHYPFPVIVNGVTPIAAICEFMGDGGDGGDILIRSTADASNFKAYITIKYVK